MEGKGLLLSEQTWDDVSVLHGLGGAAIPETDAVMFQFVP